MLIYNIKPDINLQPLTDSITHLPLSGQSCVIVIQKTTNTVVCNWNGIKGKTDEIIVVKTKNEGKNSIMIKIIQLYKKDNPTSYFCYDCTQLHVRCNFQYIVMHDFGQFSYRKMAVFLLLSWASFNLSARKGTRKKKSSLLWSSSSIPIHTYSNAGAKFNQHS